MKYVFLIFIEQFPNNHFRHGHTALIGADAQLSIMPTLFGLPQWEKSKKGISANRYSII